MATKKIDSKYVSTQPHEIDYVVKLFGVKAAIAYLIIDEMETNTGVYSKQPKITDGIFPRFFKPAFHKGKALRVNLYKALSAMGYKKAK